MSDSKQTGDGEDTEMDDLERAIDMALHTHAGDEDKASVTYIRHPLRVMEAVETRKQRIVAVLHDVVEDGDKTLECIEDKFDAEIRDAVDALTKRDGESYTEFVERAAENPIARQVKIADIEDNMDLTRLESVDQDDLDRQEKYHDAWVTLQEAD